jgi:hypothetical protein
MSPSDPRRNFSWLHHFTDARNLAKIRELGGLYSMAKLREMGAVGEGHFPGGNEWSLGADQMCGMDCYVHLCLRTNHPMEHIARSEGRIQSTRWLYIDRRVMELDGVLVTMDVSNKAGISPITLEEAGELIDYEVLKTRLDWNDPAVSARLRAMEKVEVLVPDFVPFEFFERYFPNG